MKHALLVLAIVASGCARRTAPRAIDPAHHPHEPRRQLLVAADAAVAGDGAAALAGYETACEAGDGEGCWRAALMHRYGRAPAADEGEGTAYYLRAFELYVAGCQADDAEACRAALDLRTTLENPFGHDLPEQPPETELRDRARSLYRTACEGERKLDACVGLGLIADDGYAVFIDACGAGSRIACRELALTSRSTVGDERGRHEYDRDAEFLQRLCDAGDPYGCYFRYELDGVHRPADPRFRRAWRVWREQCQGGDGHACARMADLHLRGRAPSYDHDEGFRLYGLACDLGVFWGCDQLAGH